MADAVRHVVQTSRRVQATDAPVIGKMKALIAGVQGVQSLAQGAAAPHASALLDQQSCTGAATAILRKFVDSTSKEAHTIETTVLTCRYRALDAAKGCAGGRSGGGDGPCAQPVRTGRRHAAASGGTPRQAGGGKRPPPGEPLSP